MNITYKLVRSDGSTTSYSEELRGEPGTWYQQLHEIFERHFGADIEWEHVNVWHNDEYHDMFVDETGMLKGLPVNVKATAIYRANVMAHEATPPHPDDMPAIHGDALFFDQRVWF